MLATPGFPLRYFPASACRWAFFGVGFCTLVSAGFFCCPRLQVFPWAPTVDGDFLVDTPYNMLKAGRFQKKDALLGVNRDEGTFWILFGLPNNFNPHGPSPQNLSMFNQGMDVIAWDLTADQVRPASGVFRISQRGGSPVPSKI